MAFDLFKSLGKFFSDDASKYGSVARTSNKTFFNSAFKFFGTEYSDGSDIGGNILGKPMCYPSLTDPARRIYFDTMMLGAPLVTIQPGRGEFSQLDSTNKDEVKSLMEKLVGEGDLQRAEQNTLYRNVLSSLNNEAKDFRIFNFKPAIGDFLDVSNVLISRVKANMLYNKDFNDERIGGALGATYKTKLDKWGSLVYYFDAGRSSISESNSNDYGELMIEGMLNKGAEIASEIKKTVNMFGFDAFGMLRSKQAEEGLVDAAQSATSSGVIGTIKQMTTGAKLNYPKIWKNSSFSKSYSLSFKFESPYGDLDSIFEEVYTPFLLLMALGMPIMANLSNGYQEPFLVKVDCPGWFHIDCGAVTSVSIRKAPDNEWNFKGLPKAIEISLDIIDLYSSLSVASTFTTNAFNLPMSQYLDNISGLDYQRLADYRPISAIMMDMLAYSKMGLVDNRVSSFRSNASRFVNTLPSTVSSSFSQTLFKLGRIFTN